MAVRGKSDVWLRPWLCPSVIIVCRSGRHIFSRYFSCFLFAVQWSPSRILPAHLPQNYILTESAFLFFSHFSLDLSSRPFPFHLFPIAESRKTCSITEKSINKYLFIFLILRIDQLFGLYFSSFNSRTNRFRSKIIRITCDPVYERFIYRMRSKVIFLF